MGGSGGGETDFIGIRRNPDGPTLCLEIVGNRWNLRIFEEWEGPRAETQSVGIRRNPDIPALCLGMVVNPWNLRIFD